MINDIHSHRLNERDFKNSVLILSSKLNRMCFWFCLNQKKRSEIGKLTNIYYFCFYVMNYLIWVISWISQ